MTVSAWYLWYFGSPTLQHTHFHQPGRPWIDMNCVSLLWITLLEHESSVSFRYPLHQINMAAMTNRNISINNLARLCYLIENKTTQQLFSNKKYEPHKMWKKASPGLFIPRRHCSQRAREPGCAGLQWWQQPGLQTSQCFTTTFFNVGVACWYGM